MNEDSIQIVPAYVALNKRAAFLVKINAIVPHSIKLKNFCAAMKITPFRI